MRWRWFQRLYGRNKRSMPKWSHIIWDWWSYSLLCQTWIQKSWRLLYLILSSRKVHQNDCTVHWNHPARGRIGHVLLRISFPSIHDCFLGSIGSNECHLLSWLQFLGQRKSTIMACHCSHDCRFDYRGPCWYLNLQIHSKVGSYNSCFLAWSFACLTHSKTSWSSKLKHHSRCRSCRRNNWCPNR